MVEDMESLDLTDLNAYVEWGIDEIILEVIIQHALHATAMSMSNEEARKHPALIPGFKQQIEAVARFCNRILKLQRENLIPNAMDPGSLFLCLKKEADHLRDLAGAKVGEERVRANRDAFQAYAVVLAFAMYDLHPDDPSLLELALNFSVFCYEELRDTSAAVHVVYEALYVAKGGPRSTRLASDKLKKALHENLQKWRSKTKQV